MGKERKELDTSSYGSLIAERLRELRDKHGFSMEKFRDKLAEHGAKQPNGDRIPYSTVYSWERGKENAGADLPVEMYPVIARIYGYKHTGGWLPDEVAEMAK